MPTPTKGPRLGGGPAHERLMMANLATALFEHGRITTTEAEALLATLHDGWADGLQRPLSNLPPMLSAQSKFQPLPDTGPRDPARTLVAVRAIVPVTTSAILP